MAEVDGAELGRQLRALFVEELEDNLRVLTEGLLSLEREAGGPAALDLVQGLFRAAHSLKGAAHAADVPSAVAATERLEDVLAAIRAGERQVDEHLLQSLFADVDDLAAVGRGLQQVPAAEPVAASGAAAPTAGRVRADAGLAEPPGGPERVRVPVTRLGMLVGQAADVTSASHGVQLLAGELTDLRDALSHRARTRHGSDGDARATVHVLDRLVRTASGIHRDLRRSGLELSSTAQELRLQPCSEVWAGLDRTVRELARRAGKDVQLVTEGGDVELDRDVAATLREPIVHLVRNAVDHGIEVPEGRIGEGKAPEGTVRLSATALGDRVRITVADDGAGLDVAALLAAAERQGAELEDPSDAAFLPAVSTSTSISDVSGRGVGLDAVRARVESMGGTADLSSDPGRGTTVVLDMPVTLATLRALLVRVGSEVVALPGAAVDRLDLVRIDALRHVGGHAVLTGEGSPMPVLSLSRSLGFDSDPELPPEREIAVIRLVDEASALWVDGVEDDVEGVLQPLPARVAGAPGVIGIMRLPTGRLAVVVSPAACVRRGLTLPATAPHPAGPDAAPSTILLAEDSVTTRALERSILVGAGYDVVVAGDGAEAWRLLRERGADLVVSDVDMPGVDGIELCRMIRDSAELREIPVVLVTSLGDEEDRRRGLEVGANAYIVKSAFEQTALLDAVRRLL